MDKKNTLFTSDEEIDALNKRNAKTEREEAIEETKEENADFELEVFKDHMLEQFKFVENEVDRFESKLEDTTELLMIIKTAMETLVTPYQIAIQYETTLGEVMDEVTSNPALKKAWDVYVNRLKDHYLRISLGEKMKLKDIYVPLLEEIGVLSNSESGNSLDLKILIGDSPLKIEQVGEEDE